MDSEYIQQVRYKLQKRLKRLNTATPTSFRAILVQTWKYLQNNEITSGVLDDLERRLPNEARGWAESIFGNVPVSGDSELENDGICYWVIKLSAEIPLSESVDDRNFPLMRIEGGSDETLESFRLEYVEPLFDYIDEHIDDKRMTLVLLKKYKHRCEWFRRAELFDKFSKSQQGEKALAYNLYEYLYDQGLEFHIEPESASGRPDLISAQSGKDRLVADAKIFDGENRGIGYIIKGFRQLYDYTKDFNESFGYLVIFKTCAEDLAILTPQQESAIPFVTHNGKTIFFVVIDIFDYPETASKRGKLKAHEITMEKLVENLAAPQPSAEP